MKRLNSLMVVTAVLIGTVAAQAQLKLVADSKVQRVFGGGAQSLSLVFSNGGIGPVKADLRARLVQVAAPIAVNFSENPWKFLQVLPGQTVVESAAINFPPVKAETQFLIQLVEGGSNIVGRTEVIVYPTNLLARLKTLAGDDPVGVFDPDDQLKPLLRMQVIEFQDLLEDGPDKFYGKLAIFGPFKATAKMRASLRDDIRILAKRGVAVVWLMPSPKNSVPTKPSFYVVREGGGAVVVAEQRLVAQLVERPEAQLNLLRLAQEALHPTPLDFPEIETPN